MHVPLVPGPSCGVAGVGSLLCVVCWAESERCPQRLVGRLVALCVLLGGVGWPGLWLDVRLSKRDEVRW